MCYGVGMAHGVDEGSGSSVHAIGNNALVCHLGAPRGVGGWNHVGAAACVSFPATGRGGDGDSVVVVLRRGNGMATIGRPGDSNDDAAFGWVVAQTAGECVKLVGVGGVLDSLMGSSANLSRKLSTFVCCCVQPGLRGAAGGAMAGESGAAGSLFAEAVVVPLAAGIIRGLPLVAGSLGRFGWSLAGVDAVGGASFQPLQPSSVVG